MSEKKCAICLEYMTEEDPSIIGMSGYGTPVCACERCIDMLDKALNSTDYDEIVSNMDAVYEIMKKKNNDHPLVVDIVSEMLNRAAKRAGAIKEGTYDFSLDEEENTEEEVEYIIEAVGDVVSLLRGMSPVWRDLESGKKEFILK